MKRRDQWFFGFCALTCFAALGCSESKPLTASVSGTVLYNGAPVEGAMVSFQPQDTARPAGGTTDAQGKFTLTTFAPGDGALPGNYNVIVAKITGASPSTESTDGSALLAKPEAMSAGTQTKNLLPAKYATAGTSGLKAAVKTGEKNEFKFELTD